MPSPNELHPPRGPLPQADTAGVGRVGLVGLGLIGGSLGLALAQAWPGVRRIGLDVQADVACQARSLGVVHEQVDDLEALLPQVDLLLLCQPVPALIDSLAVLGRLGRLTAQGSGRPLPVLCDVASLKQPVWQAAQQALGGHSGRFVPSHPIAGKARGGLDQAEPGLFDGRPVVWCPQQADDRARQQVAALWQAVGGHLVAMDVAQHDAVYAELSHLPQLLTWCYLHTLAQEPWAHQAGDWAGTGFASFTRLGASDPALWAGIALHNREALRPRLQRLSEALQRLDRLLAGGEAAPLQHWLDQARQALPDPAR